MMRLVRFVLQIAVFGALAFWLADRPGTARIVWHDTVIETSAAFLALCAVLFGVALHLLLRLWDFLRNGPTFWALRRKLDKFQAGQEHFTRGLVAIASGNASEAGRLAVSARKNVRNGIAAQWLQAQAAQMAGDKKAAREIFRALAAKDESAVLGYRGLVSEAKREGNWEEVDRLLMELHRLKPSTPWLSLMRMESAARHRNWAEAESALTHAISARLMDNEAGRRTRAALRVAASREAALSKDADKSLQAAEQAAKLAPDWLPAIINLAETLAATGHKRSAVRAVERAWKNHPHRQLAQLLLKLADTPLDGFKQTERLCRANESASESRMAIAEAALGADVWGEARRALTALVNDKKATKNSYKMLAQLERFERHDERAAALWLAKAADAASDPVWLCRVCCGPHENWVPTCDHCGSFNSLEWRSAGQGRKALPYEKDCLSDD
jgi:HemY protein